MAFAPGVYWIHMALTSDDKNYIKDTIIEALEAVVLPRFDEHDARFNRLEGDVAELKSDVAVLKADVAVLKTDVAELKSDMREVKHSLASLEGRVAALEADVKEIYAMLAPDKKFEKLMIEKKLLRINGELLLAAKEAGITLPR